MPKRLKPPSSRSEPADDSALVGPFRNFGLALRIARELRGLEQSDLSRRAGISRSQLSKYERGRELPKLDSLGRVLDVLNLTAERYFSIQAFLDRFEGPELPLAEHGLLSKETFDLFQQVFCSVASLQRQVIEEILTQKLRGRTGSAGLEPALDADVP